MKTNRGSNFRHKWFWIDYCSDGEFIAPRIKKDRKRRLGKKSRKEVAKQFMPIDE